MSALRGAELLTWLSSTGVLQTRFGQNGNQTEASGLQEKEKVRREWI